MALLQRLADNGKLLVPPKSSTMQTGEERLRQHYEQLERKRPRSSESVNEPNAEVGDDGDSDDDADDTGRVSMMLREPEFGTVLDLGDAYAKYGEWRSVPGFDAGKVRVSSGGWVQTFFNEHWSGVQRGYARTNRHSIVIDKSSYRVYQLICRSFHGPQPTSGHTVDHFNRNPGDNGAENLHWASSDEQNANRTTYRTRSDAKPVFVQEHGCSVPRWFESVKMASRVLQLNAGSLSKCVRSGKRKQTRGYVAWYAPAQETQECLLAGDDSNLCVLPVPGGSEQFPETGPSSSDEEWRQASSKLWISTRGRIQVMDSVGGKWGYRHTPVARNGMTYPTVLWNGKEVYVHRVVLMVFSGIHDTKTTVDHKVSTRKFDNRLCNLRWASWREQRLNQTRDTFYNNEQSKKRAVLCKPKNDRLEWEFFESGNACARALNKRHLSVREFRQSSISAVARGRTTHHNGWLFKFAET